MWCSVILFSSWWVCQSLQICEGHFCTYFSQISTLKPSQSLLQKNLEPFVLVFRLYHVHLCPDWECSPLWKQLQRLHHIISHWSLWPPIWMWICCIQWNAGVYIFCYFWQGIANPWKFEMDTKKSSMLVDLDLGNCDLLGIVFFWKQVYMCSLQQGFSRVWIQSFFANRLDESGGEFDQLQQIHLDDGGERKKYTKQNRMTLYFADGVQKEWWNSLVHKQCSESQEGYSWSWYYLKWENRRHPCGPACQQPTRPECQGWRCSCRLHYFLEQTNNRWWEEQTAKLLLIFFLVCLCSVTFHLSQRLDFTKYLGKVCIFRNVLFGQLEVTNYGRQISIFGWRVYFRRVSDLSP